MFSLCQFCKSKFAVLYCEADSANLCFFCDRHVHSANKLSLNHTRFWICHNCGHKPASFLSSNNALLLCQYCNSRSHTNCSIPAQGFSGCPSPTSVASFLGFNYLSSGSCLDGFQDGSTDGFSGSEGQRNRKKEVFDQLVEMAKSDMLRLDLDGVDLRPKTPPSRVAPLGNITERLDRQSEDDDNDELLRQGTPFTTSLVSSATSLELEHAADEEFLLWDYNPTYDSSLMWEFSFDGSKDCEESGSQTTENADCSNQPVTEMNLAKPEDCNSPRYAQKSEPLFLAGNDYAKEPKHKEDMEILAQNRGNSMLRYMEKKKTRRYDKHIRHESRKARADTRKRVKGRFVKSSEALDDEV